MKPRGSSPRTVSAGEGRGGGEARRVAAAAVLLPGFNGRATQPILVRLARRLAALGMRCQRLALARGRPSPGLGSEQAQVAAAVRGQRGPLLLVGRSFGGRVCARYAAAHGASAVILLGFPVRPPGKRRPDDEAALLALRCPTLIVQGARDPLGPLRVLRPLAARNRHLTLQVVPSAGHAYGRHEAEALDVAAAWAATVL